MDLLLARIEEDAVAVDVAVVGLVGLAAVVERDRVRPHVLLPLALLLAVVLPVRAVPEEVDVHVVLERGPRDRARLRGRRVDDDGRTVGPAPVVGPVPPPARPLLRRPLDVEPLRPRAPDVDGLVELA